MMKTTLTVLILSVAAAAQASQAEQVELIIAEEHASAQVVEDAQAKKEAVLATKKAARASGASGKEKYNAKLAAIPPVRINTASAGLLNTKGDMIGKAVFWQGAHGVIIKLYVEDLTPGSHGLHIHQHGRCEPESSFKTAKGHMKHESEKSHGFLHHQGPHAGDLPNLIVREDGTAHVELYSERFRLHYSKKHEDMMALLDGGASIMIHAKPDDYVSQPIGGAGARVACGVIAKN